MVRIGSLDVVIGVGGIDLDKGIAHGIDRHRPELDIEPNMRIVSGDPGANHNPPIDRDTFGYRHRDDCVAHLLEHFSQFGFEMETAVENDVGVTDLLYVAFAGFVGMWIDTRSHQRRDLNAIPAHDSNDVPHHTGGGHNTDLAIGEIGGDLFFDSPTGSKEENGGQKGDK